MKIVLRSNYDLLFSYNPCEIFTHYNVDEMHGLNLHNCVNHNNTKESAYIAGWCNIIPKSERHYVFINLSRCNNDIETFGLIMHELMHLSFDMHTDEEELITWAENESYQVFQLIKKNRTNEI